MIPNNLLILASLRGAPDSMFPTKGVQQSRDAPDGG